MLSSVARFSTRAITAAVLPAKYFPVQAAAAAAAAASDFPAAHGKTLDDAVADLPSDPQLCNGVSGSDLMWKPTLVYDTTRHCYAVDTSMRQSWTLCSSSVEPVEARGADAGDSGRITVMLPAEVHGFVEAFLQGESVRGELAAAGRSGGGSIVPPSPSPSPPPGADASDGDGDDAAAAGDDGGDAPGHGQPDGATCSTTTDGGVPVQCKVLAYGAGGHFTAHMDAPQRGRHVGTLVLHAPGAPHTGGALTAAERDAALPAADGPHGWSATFVPLGVVHRVSAVESGVRLSLTLPVYGEASEGEGVAGAMPAAPAVVPAAVLGFAREHLQAYAGLRADVASGFEENIGLARELHEEAQARVAALDALGDETTNVTSDELKGAWTPRQLLGIKNGDNRKELVVVLMEEKGDEVERWALQQLQAEGAELEFGKLEDVRYSGTIYGTQYRDPGARTILYNGSIPIQQHVEFDHFSGPESFSRIRHRYVLSERVVSYFGYGDEDWYREDKYEWPEHWAARNFEYTAAMDEGNSSTCQLTIPAVRVKLAQ